MLFRLQQCEEHKKWDVWSDLLASTIESTTLISYCYVTFVRIHTQCLSWSTPSCLILRGGFKSDIHEILLLVVLQLYCSSRVVSVGSFQARLGSRFNKTHSTDLTYPRLMLRLPLTTVSELCINVVNASACSKQILIASLIICFSVV